MRVRKFLVSNTEKIAANMGSFIKPRVATETKKVGEVPSSGIDYPDDDINPEDIPF